MKHLTKEERQTLIEAAIAKLNAGEIVDLVDASGYACGLCIGDFRDSGMSKKNTWRTGMNWTWNGPGSIRLSGREILQPGQESEEIDMDWT
jgi:hypothetical protein